MDPKRARVEENDAKDYLLEDVTLVPRQSATSQSANLLGRSGQSSLSRGKACVEEEEEEGHLQEGK